MQPGKAEIDWADFLGRSAVPIDIALVELAVYGQSVLITGAGGSIGSGLARAVLRGRPRTLVLLDLSESALYECYRKLSSAVETPTCKPIPVIGDVADRRFMEHLFRQYRPDLVLHMAAYKHVPLMELNPFSAIGNNAIGTHQLSVAALEAEVGRLVAVSTDKAVNPQSIMGVSKRIAEQVVLSHTTNEVHMSVMRLCNILGCMGSVAPVFYEQAEKGFPLTVTHPDAERYFLSPAEAEAAILQAAACSVPGRILIPDCGGPFRVVDLARFIAAQCKTRIADGASFEFIGLRPGDKLREELLSSEEVVEAELGGGMRAVLSPVPAAKEIAAAMQRLQRAVDTFDYAELMAIVAELVPEYKLSGDVIEAHPALEGR